MIIVEQFILGKAEDQSECEDLIVVCPDYIAVCYGVTSKSDILWEGKSPGVMAGILIEKEIRSFPSDITGYDAIQRISQCFAEFYRSRGVFQQMHQSAVDRLQACVIIYSRYRNELWLVGDCQAIIDGHELQNGKILDDIYAQTRALYLECEIAEGKTIDELLEHDSGRDFVLPLIKKCKIFSNLNSDSPLCHGVIDGFPIPERLVQIVPLAPDVQEIVLASDGYPELYNSLEKSERYLEKLLSEDPLCFRLFKSSKGVKAGNYSFDDRCYIRFYI